MSDLRTSATSFTSSSPQQVWLRGHRVRVSAPTEEAARTALPTVDPSLGWVMWHREPYGNGYRYHFEVRTRAEVQRNEEARRAVGEMIRERRTAARTMTVSSADELPPAPAGYRWELLGVMNMVPRKYQYGLMPAR